MTSRRISVSYLLFGVCLLLASVRPATGTQSTASAPALYLVVPFENPTGEARGYWLSEASVVLLTDDLLALGASSIRREDRLRAFERLRVPPVANLSHATVIRLGQVVGAAHVVIGGFEVQGDDLTVRARTIRLDTGHISPELMERGPLADMLSVYGRIARRIVPQSTVSTEQLAGAHPPLPVFEQYIKGLLAEAPEAKIAFLDAGAAIVAGIPSCADRSLGGAYGSGRPSGGARCRASGPAGRRACAPGAIPRRDVDATPRPASGLVCRVQRTEQQRA